MGLITTVVDGQRITIETTGHADGMELTGLNTVSTQAEKAFNTAVETIRHISRQLVTAIRDMGDEGPESFDISFGVKFTAGGDVWLAKATAEAQIVAKVSWKRVNNKQ